MTDAAASKLTPQVRATILDRIHAGCFLYQASAVAGVTPKTVRAWEATALAEPASECAAFLKEVRAALEAKRASLTALRASKLVALGAALEAGRGPTAQEAVQIQALRFQIELRGGRLLAEASDEISPVAAAAVVREAFSRIIDDEVDGESWNPPRATAGGR